MSFNRIDEGSDSWGAGVCAGIAYTFGIQTWLIRLAVVLSSSYTWWIYILLWALVPLIKKPKDFDKITK